MNLNEAVAKIVREALERAQPDDAKKLSPLLGDMKLDASNEIDEAHGWIDPKTGQEVWADEDDADIRDLYLDPEAFNDSPHGKLPSKDDFIVAKPKREADLSCEVCGGMKNEGTCECAMTEGDPADEDESWLSHIASKVKKLAMKDVGGPQGVFTPSVSVKKKGGPSQEFLKWQAKQSKQANESVLRRAIMKIVCEVRDEDEDPTSDDFGRYSAAVRRAKIATGKDFSMDNVPSNASARTMGKAGPADKPPPKWKHPDHRVDEIEDEDDGTKCPECGGPPGKHDPKCPHAGENPPVNETLRDLIAGVVKEMKLGVAGGGHFDFSQKDSDDDDDVASFLLNKKAKEEETPPPKKSGTKLSTSRRRSKSSKFR